MFNFYRKKRLEKAEEELRKEKIFFKVDGILRDLEIDNITEYEAIVKIKNLGYKCMTLNYMEKYFLVLWNDDHDYRKYFKSLEKNGNKNKYRARWKSSLKKALIHSLMYHFVP